MISSLETLEKYLMYCNERKLSGSAYSVCQYMVENYPDEREKAKEMVLLSLGSSDHFLDRMTFDVDLFCEMHSQGLTDEEQTQEIKEKMIFLQEYLPDIYTACLEIIETELGKDFLN